MTTFVHIRPRASHFPPRLEPAPMSSPSTAPQYWVPRTASPFSDDEREYLNRRIDSAKPPMSWISNTVSSALLRSLRGVTTIFGKEHMPRATVLLASEPDDAMMIAEWFAEVLHADPKLICVELGEFTEDNHCVELTGWPPGYKGYGEATPLQAAIESSELPIVLFKDLQLSSYGIQGVLRSYIEPHEPGGSPQIALGRSVLLAAAHCPLALVRDDALLEKEELWHRATVSKALAHWIADDGLLDRFRTIVKI